ncbi:MAG TPA: putative phage abortive infection protein [Cyclobacteriaceae bacterium]|nr:putative phage abortive infection protein [Cyclobacteriaceae bacterium]
MKWTTIRFFLIAFILILGSIYLYMLVLRSALAPDLFFNITAWQTTGPFGDSFGLLTALFSALAFAGVIYSLLEQDKHIKEQDRHTQIDRFEAKFFLILQAQREIVGEFDLKRPNAQTKVREVYNKGRECFRDIYKNKFKNQLFDYYTKKYPDKELSETVKEDIKTLRGLLTLDQVVAVYCDDLFDTYQDDLGHYFRHLYRIVRLIHKSDSIEKSEYFGILRAQLSAFELVNIFYNCLTDRGADFKPLIEQYGLLKNINPENLINGDDDKTGYAHGAFEPGQPSNRIV